MELEGELDGGAGPRWHRAPNPRKDSLNVDGAHGTGVHRPIRRIDRDGRVIKLRVTHTVETPIPTPGLQPACAASQISSLHVCDATARRRKPLAQSSFGPSRFHDSRSPLPGLREGRRPRWWRNAPRQGRLGRASTMSVCLFITMPAAVPGAALDAGSFSLLSARPVRRSVSRWPWVAAAVEVRRFHGQPLARSHCRTPRCPRAAADLHVPAPK